MNYVNCLKFANKIQLEFPILKIFIDKNLHFFKLPPRNLFIFSREMSGDFGYFKQSKIYFVSDAELTGDDLFMPASTTRTPYNLELTQLCIDFDDLKNVIKKLNEVCPERAFERVFLNTCVYGEREKYKNSFGIDLIKLIYRVIIFTIGMVKKGRSNLLITHIDAEAYGNDLLMLIRNLTINRLMSPANKDDDLLPNVGLPLLMDEGEYDESFGRDLVNYINSCSTKAIRDSKAYMDDVL